MNLFVSFAGIDLDQHEALSLVQTALGEQTDDPIYETRLTVDQYSALMLRHVGSSELNDELRRTFDAFDIDRDGKISREDFDRLRDERNFFDKLDDEQYELIVKELFENENSPKNKNDGIDFESFVRLMMN